MEIKQGFTLISILLAFSDKSCSNYIIYNIPVSLSILRFAISQYFGSISKPTQYLSVLFAAIQIAKGLKSAYYFFVYLFVLFRKHAIINIKQEIVLVTDKCLPICHIIPNWYPGYYWEDRLTSVFKYFTKSSCAIDIKEEELSIHLGDGEWHSAKCHYITINDIPALFIIPEENPKTLDFLENNQELANKIYGVIIYHWLIENKKHSSTLQNLHNTFEYIHSKISNALKRLKYCDMDFNDLPIDMINAIKEKFIEFHSVYYERYNKEISEDLSEKLWLYVLNSSSLKKEILKSIKSELNFDNCSNQKVFDIVFHNEIMRFLLERNEYLKVTLQLKYKKIKLNLFITLKNKISIINWIYGSLSSILGYPLLKSTVFDLDNFEKSKNSCKKIHGKIKNYNVNYELYGMKPGLRITNVVADCVGPKDYMIGVKAEFTFAIRLNRMHKYFWFYNDKVILNRMIELYKIVTKMIKVYEQIDRKLLFTCSVLV